ncbi:Cys-tRNA(Pro) deacylase [Herbiconiux moechotypicola]|uniref:Cys-tRNA(Pro)/Cys-tRNA(Cys) deacylase n=1 Tax=Herbiconiux moechotypicola TaxID=637393 RepID=A0ABN3DTY6_9MICO|nr:Cys-tRNA(Pro) deacylase [Herbiconiux moechotypicola]MCS5730497.1 Cys-tRNA(Pro) deacylase [Herbiconiux moechotypicola]
MAARKGKAASPSTAATLALVAAGIDFVPHVYEHRAGSTDFGAEAARELGVEQGRVFKTLLVETDAGLGVGVVSVADQLDLKALAAELGAKKASMADPAVAERKTGYVVGGISPVGQKTRLATVVDESALGYETVFVSGGRRGFDLEIAPADLVRAVGGTTGVIRRG